MPKIVATHAVKDVEVWLAGRQARAAAIGEFGTNVVDYAPVDDRNVVATTADIYNMDGLVGAMATPEMQALEAKHGVIHPISVFVQS